ncbi:MAG: hypothetical protein IKQ17_07660 [Kiritimatiellae bacterium]|nr:hypothetical protein [Kiritimatiellia bacterium]
MNQTASNVSCLASLVACLVLATVAFADSTNAVPPTLFQPVVLKDADGNAELDLVDPFRRRGADEDGGVAATAEDGLMRTTMGEISSEFRILAITIPQDTNTPRAALIQFHDADEPILVHEGDLVRVDRTGAAGRGRAGKPSRPRASANARNSLQRGQSGRAASTRPQFPVSLKSAGQDSDLEEQLKKFVFYVNVKHIEPTFIEVYHNKKRPDETIRLNW